MAPGVKRPPVLVHVDVGGPVVDCEEPDKVREGDGTVGVRHPADLHLDLLLFAYDLLLVGRHDPANGDNDWWE